MRSGCNLTLLRFFGFRCRKIVTTQLLRGNPVESSYISCIRMSNRESINQSLLHILEGSERKLQQAINLSNGTFRLFNNLCFLEQNEEGRLRSHITVPLQDWLQSFLLLLRDNTRHHQNVRSTIIDWVRSRGILPERYRTLEQ